MLKNRVIAAGCLLLLACCDEPPPVTAGKCTVDLWKGNTAWKQNCVYKGYNFFCTSSDNQCLRTGEATGEQAK